MCVIIQLIVYFYDLSLVPKHILRAPAVYNHIVKGQLLSHSLKGVFPCAPNGAYILESL